MGGGVKGGPYLTSSVAQIFCVRRIHHQSTVGSYGCTLSQVSYDLEYYSIFRLRRNVEIYSWVFLHSLLSYTLFDFSLRFPGLKFLFRAGSKYHSSGGSLHKSKQIYLHPNYVNSKCQIDFDYALASVSSPTYVSTNYS